jgi:hypothetical protein
MTITAEEGPPFASDAEALAWYRATYDDDQAEDELVLARLDAWARGQSLGPDVQGIPRRQARPATAEEEALIAGAEDIPRTGTTFAIYGLRVGHGCDHCARLTIQSAAVNTSGASYELVAGIMAGDSHDRPESGLGRVDIRAEDLPHVIDELQRIYSIAQQAEAEQCIPPGWPIS